MNVDYLIVGQGLCGTWLSYFLMKAGKSVLVYDDADPASSSRIASGIINPVTGRRIVKTWMIDELLPFARNAYSELSQELSADLSTDIRIIDFFPTPQMRLAFLDRYREDQAYLSLPSNENSHRNFFNYDFGYGLIYPCLLINTPLLISLWRRKLGAALVSERLDVEQLRILDDGIMYEGHAAERIVFCDGTASAESKFFRNLPFAPNKGEALIVRIPDLPRGEIYKRGISLVPWQDGTWWVGSSHEWAFETAAPTKLFRDRTEASLRALLKLPYSVEDHVASVRPATLERRPFVGYHPLYKRVGILNGMGSKGCSLASWFAKELVEGRVSKEGDVGRFERVLSRRN